MQIDGRLKIFSGSANRPLAREIADCIGISLGKAELSRFSDGEITLNIKESVRGYSVFLIQPICNPVNENIMELLVLMDAVRRASAKSVNAVVPYYGYARQDRKTRARDPITAKLVADLITAAGADRVVAMDLHAGQIQGFFDMPGDELTAFPFLARHIEQLHIPDLTVLSADLGFAKKARNIAEMLQAPVAFIEKRRLGTSTESLNVIGDVRGRNVLIVDDEVDGAGTIAGAAAELREEGACDIYACFVHPTFSAGAVERLQQAKFTRIVTTNTEPIPPEHRMALPNLEIIHLGPWLACVIDAVHRGVSVGGTLTDYYAHCETD